MERKPPTEFSHYSPQLTEDLLTVPCLPGSLLRRKRREVLTPPFYCFFLHPSTCNSSPRDTRRRLLRSTNHSKRTQPRRKKKGTESMEVMPTSRESRGQLQQFCAKARMWHWSTLCTQHSLWCRRPRHRALPSANHHACDQTTACGPTAARGKLTLTRLAQELFQDWKGDKPLALQKLSCHEVLPWETHGIAAEKARMVLSWSKVDGKDPQPKSLVLNPLEEFWIRPVG